jgi:hypothetical protein
LLTAAAVGSPKPQGTSAPRPAGTSAPRPAVSGPAPGATGAPAAAAAAPGASGAPSSRTGTTPGSSGSRPAGPGASSPGGPASAAPGSARPGTTAASPGGPAPGPSASPSSTGSSLNDKLRALLPHNAVVPGHYAPGLDPNAAVEAYEKALTPPAYVLAATFGLIRVSRTVVHADSIAYVFERKKDLFGREVCKAYRITDHPKPPPPTPPPSLSGGFARPYIPDRPPDLKPVLEFVEVSCNDPRMERIAPGGLTTPVPRHP